LPDPVPPTHSSAPIVSPAEIKENPLPSLTPASSLPPPPSSEPVKPKGTPKTLKLTDLLKTDKKEDAKQAAVEKVMSESYTEQQLRQAWDEFAGTRKHLQAESQMLSQAYEIKDHLIVVTLLSPVHETMLNNIKLELAAFLRDKVKNTAIQVTGLLTTSDDKKVIYTNRDKFDYLAEKNPILKELKDRLGLDTDF
jgi:DNA polymerase-3 subunit gamma/tau